MDSPKLIQFRIFFIFFLLGCGKNRILCIFVLLFVFKLRKRITSWTVPSSTLTYVSVPLDERIPVGLRHFPSV